MGYAWIGWCTGIVLFFDYASSKSSMVMSQDPTKRKLPWYALEVRRVPQQWMWSSNVWSLTSPKLDPFTRIIP